MLMLNICDQTMSDQIYIYTSFLSNMQTSLNQQIWTDNNVDHDDDDESDSNSLGAVVRNWQSSVVL